MKIWRYSGAKITFAPDSALTVNDLEFRDLKGPFADGAWVARYERDPSIGGTDFVTFNTSMMANRTRDYQNSAAAHEIGHALGLCHKADSVKSLVRKAIQDPPLTGPQAVDKANYRKLWG
ncbi:hypothetical protein [Streptomyces sp. NPDC003863]